MSWTGCRLGWSADVLRGQRKTRAVLPIRDENGGDIEAAAYRYINRLSDLIFVLAHKADSLGS